MKDTVQSGQINLSGDIKGIDKLVNKPDVIEHDGLKVVRLVIPEKEISTKGYIEEALKIAKKLSPDIKSKEKPVWLQKNWQVKRRKRKAGIKL